MFRQKLSAVSLEAIEPYFYLCRKNNSVLKASLKKFPFIRQAGFMECGTSCLAMIFKHYGYYDIRNFLSEQAQVNTEGTDLLTLSELAEGFGFETDGYELGYEDLTNIQLPCIAHYNGNHFVVVYKVNKEEVFAADPAIGKYKLSRKEFEAKWNGIVLVLNPTSEIFKNNELTTLAEESKSKRKSLFRHFYLSSFLSSKKSIYLVLVTTLLLQLLNLALPYFTQTIIDKVLVSNNLKLLYAILAGMAVVFVSQIILLFSRNVILVQLKIHIERSFFSKFFSHFLSLQQSFFDRHKKEDFINRFQENIKIRKAFSPTILETIVEVLFVFVYLIVLFYYNLTLGLVSAGFIGLYLLFTIALSPKLKNLESRIFAENVKTMGQFLDTLMGIQTVRLLGIEKIRFWRWKNQYTKALNMVLTTERTYIILSTSLQAVFLGGQAIIYWSGAYLTYMGELSIGEYIAFITIFMIVINSLSRLSQLWFLFTELSVTFDKLNDVLVQDTINKDDDKNILMPSGGEVSFEKVSFKYQNNQERNTLDNISFKIKEGNFVGIIGRNGSGKTTLVKVLCKLYEQYEGDILLNNCELRHVNTRYFRNKISVIPQDVFLFDGTIKENILYANPDATDEELIQAAKLADIHEFIKDQYLGYNLRIGENGVNVSGGQKLKIAFARLFISNPDIIIIDEASSALDVQSEMLIMNNLKEKFKNKTIISVAHRLHTIKDADQILVLENGALVENDSPQNLMEQKGLYYQFMKTYVNF